MKILNAHLIGRFGNQMFQYAYARKYAEINGYELRTNEWPGQKIFEGVNEGPMVPGEETMPENYRQTQDDLIYTRSECKKWFQWRGDVESKLTAHTDLLPLAHRRVGDYLRLGYVVVSKESYLTASHGLMQPLGWVTEEQPDVHPDFTGDLAFVPDFYRMTKCRKLYRANSSFSWWAATLSDAEVWSPIIDGKEGGKEHDCDFIRGNWPKLANLPCCTDLHLPE